MYNLIPIPLQKDEAIEESINLNEILKLRILPSDNIPMPDVVLSFNGQMVMTRKNISCITGKAKVGKTFLLTLLTQIALKKGDMNQVISSYLPKGKDKIIYIDTEQSDYHILLILKRIQEFVGEVKMDNLYMFNFDAIDIDQRRAYAKELIYQMDGVGLVIIDGVADLIYDTNDLKESNILCSDLRKWSVERDVHVLNIIHQNPSDNSKMRGHAGTILTNKSETVIQISTSKENESIKLVETLATRNKKPEPFAFEISEKGNPEIIDYDFGDSKPEKKLTKKDLFEMHKNEIVLDIFTNLKDIGIGRGELESRFRRSFLAKTGESIGELSSKSYSKELIDTSYVFKNQTDSKYYLGNVIDTENSFF